MSITHILVATFALPVFTAGITAESPAPKTTEACCAATCDPTCPPDCDDVPNGDKGCDEAKCAPKGSK